MFDPQSGPAIFLQPHADDVALSCGGCVAAISSAKARAHIVTLFAGEIVPELVGSFAEWKHRRWNLVDPDEVISTRRLEDAEAAAILGSTIRWLGLPDAIYRGDTTSDDELFGPIDPKGLALAEHLVEELINLPEWDSAATVFAPLGIGSHLDHQIAFQAGCLLAGRGHRVLAWEDAPYVIHSPDGLPSRLEQIGDRLGAPTLVPITEHLEKRLEAIAAYASQVPVIFRFTDDFRSAVETYARERGGGVPAERLWPVIG